MKTYRIHYSLTFHNTVDIQADSKTEAKMKFNQLDRDSDLHALDGVEDGYEIALIEEVTAEVDVPAPPACKHGCHGEAK